MANLPDLDLNASVAGAVIPAHRPLEAVAADINLAHREAQQYAAKAVERALTAGDLLLEAKTRVAHGQWLPWLKENCPDISTRTIQNYMRVARELPVEMRSAAHLPNSLRDALRITSGDPDPEPATADLFEPEPPTAFHDRITSPLIPATPAPAVSVASVASMLAELPEPERKAVLETTAATVDLKVVRSDARYLHVSQARHEWYTPAEYIEAARDVMGGIDLDPASCEIAQATVKARMFFSKEQDGLAQPWKGRIWLNPPFESAVITPFVAKLLADYQAGAIQQAIVLTDAATDTRWFHDLANLSKLVCFTKGRISFTSPLTDSQAPQRGQAFMYLGDRPDAFVARFKPFGIIAAVAS
jgi:phage N-6-adenine-methyltransferase